MMATVLHANLLRRVWQLAVLLLLGSGARAQAPAWQMAVSLSESSGNESQVSASVADAGGNVYLAGSFTNTATFGTTTLTSAGDRDVFVAKWSQATGRFVWAVRAGGPGYDAAKAVAVAGAAVYVAGEFRSATVAFGPAVLTNANPSPLLVGSDVFVAKLTDAGPTGGFAWAQRAGGSGYDFATALAVQGSAVYVAGGFVSNAASFGPTTVASVSGTDLFVAKLTDAGPSGAFGWVQAAGGTNNDVVNALAVSGAAVYAAGTFDSPTLRFGATTLATAGRSDVFVARLTDAGPTSSFAWAQRAGGNGLDFANALAVQGSAVYVAGGFVSATASFGPTTLTNVGSYGNDVFVAKLTDEGAGARFGWALRAGGEGYEVALALAVSGPNVYLAGDFTSETSTFGTTTLTNASTDNSYDAFVARLTDAGPTARFEWAQRAGGTASDDRALALAVLGTGVYVAGHVNPPARFGSQVLAGTPGNVVGFMALLTDARALASAPASAAADFALYPNPAHGRATVQLPAAPGAAAAVLTLCDALGRPVRVLRGASGGTLELPLDGLAPGLYCLRVQTGPQYQSRTLVVE